MRHDYDLFLFWISFTGTDWRYILQERFYRIVEKNVVRDDGYFYQVEHYIEHLDVWISLSYLG